MSRALEPSTELEPVELVSSRPALRPSDILRGVSGLTGRLAALDVGIMCPQAAGHLGVAAQGAPGAAEGYARATCGRGDIEKRCRDAGVLFQPLICESFGGVSAEAERVLK